MVGRGGVAKGGPNRLAIREMRAQVVRRQSSALALGIGLRPALMTMSSVVNNANDNWTGLTGLCHH